MNLLIKINKFSKTSLLIILQVLKGDTATKKAITFLLFFLIGFTIYGNSLHNGFMIDDHAFFTEKLKNVKYLHWWFIPDLDSHLGINGGKPHVYYRPLAHILPMIAHLLFGAKTFGYHVINLLLFVGAGFMISRVISRFFKAPLVGVLTGVFYLAHPLNGVFVNYITASVFGAQIILMCTSLLLLWESVNHWKGFKKFFGLIGTVVCFILSVMCHETAMGLPFYALILFAVNQPHATKKWRVCVAGLFAVLIAYFLWRMTNSSLNVSILSKFARYDMSLWQYLATLTKLMQWYLIQFVFPTKIVLIYATPVIRFALFKWIVGGLALLTALGAAVWKVRNDPLKLTGMLWWIIGFGLLIPASVFQPVHGMMIEPHWFIFSSIGMFMVLAQILLCKISLEDVTQAHGGFKPLPMGIFILCLCLIIPWGYISRQYNKLWGDEVVYCQNWLKVSPGFTAAEFYLAKRYEINKEYDKARFHYFNTLKQMYRPSITLTNLALMDLVEGDFESADLLLQESLKYDPHAAITVSNLGAVAYSDERYEDALGYFERSKLINWMAVLPRLNVAKTLLKLERRREAIVALKEIFDIVPNHEIALVELLRIYYADKNREGVINVGRELLAYSNNTVVLNNLSLIFDHYQMGHEAERARKKFENINKNNGGVDRK
jgi:hypothetical protein